MVYGIPRLPRHVYAVSTADGDACLVTIIHGDDRAFYPVKLVNEQGYHDRSRFYVAGLFYYWRSFGAKIVRLV